uniref:Pentraxin-related protein PTX3-like n=1 Tax=Hirondellea gigas TaxID=1518452 RepID=A0A2P2I982_9CRUS
MKNPTPASTTSCTPAAARSVLWCVFVVMLLGVQAVSAKKIVFPSSGNPTCPGNRLHKITLVQSNYVQYSEFVTPVPALRAVSTCFWMTVQDANRAATPLNYAVDEQDNTDNLTVQYRPSEGSWTLNINGVRVYTARAVPLTPQRWHHLCHSWDGATGQWSVWQDGSLMDSGVNTRSIGTEIPAGGTMVTGQHQNTLANMGMDAGEGLTGSLTLLHVSSTPLGNPQSYPTLRLVQHLATDCTATDRGDVVGWLRTPTRGYGGVLQEVAFQNCGRF